MKMWARRNKYSYGHSTDDEDYVDLYLKKKDLLKIDDPEYLICYSQWLNHFKISFAENEIKRLEISIKEI